jgi:6,7-dimethyl-8-ribityllumazine synthase
MFADKTRILIIEARFYDHLADELLKGAKDMLTAHDADFDVVTVPGALEIPGAIAYAEEGGHRPAGVRYDGYVALGTIIRGETYHFEVVSNESARAIMDLSIMRRLAIGNGILTVENEAQALARARSTELNKGGGAASAALEMIKVRKRLLGHTR